MAGINSTILIIDDVEAFSDILLGTLRNMGYQVTSVRDFQSAATALPAGVQPFLVFADRNIGGIDAERSDLVELKRAFPSTLVIVYTLQGDLTPQQESEILSQGAIRVLDRLNVANYVERLVQEVEELQELSLALTEFTESRDNLASLVVGADVGLTLIDKEYVCWFANKAQRDLVGRPCVGARCWRLFHDHPFQMGPCWGCGVRDVFSTKQPTHRIILTRLPNLTLSWLSVQCKPIFDKKKDVIAASEAVSVCSNDLLHSIGATERLFLIARGMLHAGFGRARIYSATPVVKQKKLLAAASRLDPIDGRGYFKSLQGIDLNYTDCPYSRKAVEQRMGLLVTSWDEFGESPFKPTLDLTLPYFTVPIWNDRGDQLIGFIAADFNDCGDHRDQAVQYLAKDETLRSLREEYGKEVRTALAMLLGGEKSVPAERAFRQEIAEVARLKIGAASSVEEASAAIQEAFEKLGPTFAFTVRRKVDTELVLEPRLSVLRDIQTPQIVPTSDPNSLAAYVLQVYRRPIWINDYPAHQADTGGKGFPRGLSIEGMQSVAHLPLLFEARIYGTLSIDCRESVKWEDGYHEPLNKLVELTALVLRELRIQDELKASKAKLAALVAFASTATHDATWRHGAIQKLQALSAQASVLFSAVEHLKGARVVAAAPALEATISGIEKVANTLDDAAAMLKRTSAPKEKPTEPACKLREALEDVAGGFKRRGVRLATEYPDCCVAVAKRHLRRMVEYLLDNALRACKRLQPPRTIELRAEVVGQKLHLDVIDDGPGIPEHLRDMILSGPVASTHGGEGMGLLIVRGTALQCGGDLELIRATKPTQFRLVLPIDEQASKGGSP